MNFAVKVLREWSGRDKVHNHIFAALGFLELLHLYQAIPWCHSSFLGGQEAISYLKSIPFLSGKSCFALLHSSPSSWYSKVIYIFICLYKYIYIYLNLYFLYL